MTLTPDRISLIRQTFHDLAAEKQTASQRFYELLFEIAPDLRSLFRGDMGNQGMRFMSTLGTILDDIDNPEALAPHVERLAKGHAALACSFIAPQKPQLSFWVAGIWFVVFIVGSLVSDRCDTRSNALFD